MDTVSKVLRVIVELGLAVYAAIKAGDRERTVGEIFDGVTKDMTELDRLELARFGPEEDPGEHPEDNPETDLE